MCASNNDVVFRCSSLCTVFEVNARPYSGLRKKKKREREREIDARARTRRNCRHERETRDEEVSIAQDRKPNGKK